MNVLNQKHYFGRFTKIQQFGTIEEYIYAFEQLDFHTKCMTYTFFKKCFISGLKEEIHSQVLLAFPTTWIKSYLRSKEAQKFVNAQINK